MIMGAILVLIAWYLIISIAMNIVKPIKNLKYLIKGMNVNTGEFDINSNSLAAGGPASSSKNVRNNPNISFTTKRNFQNENTTELFEGNDEYKNSDLFPGEQIEYDEETLEMRSDEMDKLFNIFDNHRLYIFIRLLLC
jgi:hypothetical protein